MSIGSYTTIITIIEKFRDKRHSALNTEKTYLGLISFGVCKKCFFLFAFVCNAKSSEIAFFFIYFFIFSRVFLDGLQQVFSVCFLSWCCRHVWSMLDVLHWIQWQVIVSTFWNFACVSMTFHVSYRKNNNETQLSKHAEYSTSITKSHRQSLFFHHTKLTSQFSKNISWTIRNQITRCLNMVL